MPGMGGCWEGLGGLIGLGGRVSGAWGLTGVQGSPQGWHGVSGECGSERGSFKAGGGGDPAGSLLQLGAPVMAGPGPGSSHPAVGAGADAAAQRGKRVPSGEADPGLPPVPTGGWHVAWLSPGAGRSFMRS